MKKCLVPITCGNFRANKTGRAPKEYGDRNLCYYQRPSVTLDKTPWEHYQGLKPKSDGLQKNVDIEKDLRTVLFDPEYNHYDPTTDDNLAVLRSNNAGRDVELCQKACDSHAEQQTRRRDDADFEKILSSWDIGCWLDKNVQSSKG